ncbi:putative leader peptide [Kribbella alba]|uniref:putative leader peptide n=1 Tax=Kribbella alba TaxID=190197 RepID=UPI003CD09C43
MDFGAGGRPDRSRRKGLTCLRSRFPVSYPETKPRRCTFFAFMVGMQLNVAPTVGAFTRRRHVDLLRVASAACC